MNIFEIYLNHLKKMLSFLFPFISGIVILNNILKHLGNAEFVHKLFLNLDLCASFFVSSMFFTCFLFITYSFPIYFVYRVYTSKHDSFCITFWKLVFVSSQNIRYHCDYVYIYIYIYCLFLLYIFISSSSSSPSGNSLLHTHNMSSLIS